MFDIIRAAGWPIWPLLAASIIAVALIIERAITLRRGKIVPAGLVENVIADFKRRVWEVDARRGLDRVWKPAGVTFLESLPDLH